MENVTKTPLVSVIIPAYNAERFISQTISALVKQTYQNFELLIIDDASTDRTVAVIEKYQARDRRIIVYKHSQNTGQVVSRNEALRSATGKYIAINDHDDISLPDRLHDQVAYLESHPDIFLVASIADRIDDSGHVVDSVRPPFDHETIAKQLLQRNIFIHSSVMYRNDPGNIFYRPKMHFVDDYDLLLRLLTQKKKFVCLPQTLIQYRSGANTQTLRNLGKVEMFAEKARQFYHERQKGGQDTYESFQPQAILSLDPENTDNPTILRGEIQAAFRLNRFPRVREFCRKYFRKKGLMNKMLLYYIASYFPIFAISGLRKRKG
ncbi:MAG: glycosyltransferase family A protein [Patescibacteria group bacterium]